MLTTSLAFKVKHDMLICLSPLFNQTYPEASHRRHPDLVIYLKVPSYMYVKTQISEARLDQRV